jgi:hypothetical protein
MGGTSFRSGKVSEEWSNESYYGRTAKAPGTTNNKMQTNKKTTNERTNRGLEAKRPWVVNDGNDANPVALTPTTAIKCSHTRS